MKKLLVMLLALVPVLGFAYDVEEDGIYYDINMTNRKAFVTNDGAWDEGLTEMIGSGLYSGKVVIPSSISVDGAWYDVAGIREWAFYECGQLTSIEIPSSVTFIGSRAFFGCYSLTSLNIPSSVKSIEESAFSGCYSLTSIEIQNGVTSIGNDAFSGCDKLTSIKIPSSITYMGFCAFSGCWSLTSVEIQDGATCVSGFENCTSLTSIKIPSSVTWIGNGAFKDCTSLKSIEIPSSVIDIEPEAFAGCTSLTSIDLPSSVTTIGHSAFSGCTALTTIELPADISYIDMELFSGCTSLTSITIPSGVTGISNEAFKGCSALSSIEIPSGVFYIYEGTFDGCSSLKTIEIPGSVTEINSNAFANCESLTDFYYYATKLPSGFYYWEPSPIDIFDGSSIKSATLHVPSAVFDDFKATAPWSNFGKIVITDESNLPPCVTPTISIKAGELEFSCMTKGAKIHYEMCGTQASSGTIEEGKVSIPTHITVAAYATANGYRRSETVEYQLPFNPGLRGDVNQDGEVTVADVIEVTNIILEKEGEME